MERLGVMESRLQSVGGGRLVPLRRSDAPRVAQALVDAMAGQARVLSGVARDTAYVEIVRDTSYTVVVREEDWRKIYVFLRYSTQNYTPVTPPGNPPDQVLSPQPNRTMQPPPEIPSEGLTSFMAGMTFLEYQQLQKLLTLVSLDQLNAPVAASRPARNISYAAPWIPSTQRVDTTFRDSYLYNRVVRVLELLFPADFPIATI